MTATPIKNAISVVHSSRHDVGREFLTISVPNGWDDVKKIKDKILDYKGKAYKFTGWNSDSNNCFFARPIHEDCEYATFR